MATIVTKTIKPSGGDYTSLAAWQAARAGDITAAGRDTIEIAECYSMEDTTSLLLSGWTTDADHYVKIYTPTSERHDGKWNTSKYRLGITGTGVMAIEIGAGYFWIDGLQVSLTLNGSSGTSRGIYFSGATGELKLSNCLIKGIAGAYSPTVFDGFRSYNVSPNYIIKLWNNIFYDFDAGTGYGVHTSYNSQGAQSGSYVYNCTAENCKYGFILNENVIAKNCLSQNMATDGFYATSSYHASCSDNCSDISSDIPNASGRTGTVTFAGTEDYHLDASDTVAQGYGADLSGTFTTDIDGVTISTWSIGGDAQVGSGSTPKSVTDSGGGSDATPTITVSAPQTDSGSGSDATPTIAVSVPQTDTGSGSDATPSIAVVLSDSDSGSGSDEPSVSALLGTSDTGSGSDSDPTISASSPVTDTGSGDDSISSLSASIPITETGSGSESTDIAVVMPAITDDGSGTESLGLIANVPISDSGTIAESELISAELLVSDLGEGTDTVFVYFLVPITDSGSGSESDPIILAAIPVSDSGTIDEAIGILTVTQLDDSGAGVDDVTVNTGTIINIGDIGSGSDSLSIAVSLSLSDTGNGSDDPLIGAGLSLSDTGSGVDTLSVSILISLNDSGSADTEDVSHNVYFAVADICAGSEPDFNISVSAPVSDYSVGMDSVWYFTQLPVIPPVSCSIRWEAPEMQWHMSFPSIKENLNMKIVDEGSDIFLEMNFYDEKDADVIPILFRYKIIDSGSGEIVKELTEIVPGASSYMLLLSGDATAIYDETNSYELKVLGYEWTYEAMVNGISTTITDTGQLAYKVRALETIPLV